MPWLDALDRLIEELEPTPSPSIENGLPSYADTIWVASVILDGSPAARARLESNPRYQAFMRQMDAVAKQIKTHGCDIGQVRTVRSEAKHRT